MDKQTQQARIIAFCKKHGSITVADMQAMHMNSPTKRIAEINANPRYQVEKENVVKRDSEGRQLTHYTRYRISEVSP